MTQEIDEPIRIVEGLGYEHLGEANVPGREYFRRRAAHDTSDNLLFRDFLRAHPEAAAEYARSKKEAWQGGAGAK
jgi:hypothetical protein